MIVIEVDRDVDLGRHFCAMVVDFVARQRPVRGRDDQRAVAPDLFCMSRQLDAFSGSVSSGPRNDNSSPVGVRSGDLHGAFHLVRPKGTTAAGARENAEAVDTVCYLMLKELAKNLLVDGFAAVGCRQRQERK